MNFYYHNQTVEFNVIKSKIPSRKDFIDKELNEQISYDIKNKKPLYFLGNDVKENAPFRDFEIVLSGILPCGSKTTVTIVNISPYVDVAISKEFSKSYKVLSKVMAKKSITYNTIVLVKGKNLLDFLKIPIRSLLELNLVAYLCERSLLKHLRINMRCSIVINLVIIAQYLENIILIYHHGIC